MSGITSASELLHLVLVVLPIRICMFGKEKARNAWRECLETVPPEDRSSLDERELLYLRIFKAKFKENI